MKTLFLFLLSFTLLSYNSTKLDTLLASNKPDNEKITELLKMEAELKTELRKIAKQKKQFIKKAKQNAIKIMKDKNKTDLERMKAWILFTKIATGTKYAKSGKKMAYKFSKKAFRNLRKQLKKEETQKNKNYDKIIEILDKILTLQISKKQKTRFESKRNKYKKEWEKILQTRERTIKKTDVKKEINKEENNKEQIKAEEKTVKEQINKPSDQEKAEAKTTNGEKEIKKEKNIEKITENENNNKKEEIQKTETKISSVSHKHPLNGKTYQEFRASVYNKDKVKQNMLDISDFVGIDANQKKKLLILTFYANYCKPCKRELPFLNTLYRKYKDKGLMIIAVNTDKDKDEIEEVKKFIKENNLEFPVLRDSFNIISRRYSIENFPTMFLIKSDGKIIKVTVGYDDNEAKLENDIINLLK